MYFAQIIQAPTKPKGEPVILFVAMGWFHLVFVLVLLNIHEICLKLKSRFRIIHKSPILIPSYSDPLDLPALHCPDPTPIRLPPSRLNLDPQTPHASDNAVAAAPPAQPLVACLPRCRGLLCLWAMGEVGMRAWDLADALRPLASRQWWGDEVDALFSVSWRMTPALSFTSDPAHRVMWNGHTDGRIMGWDTILGPEAWICLAWETHHGLVFALAVSNSICIWHKFL
jgi:hypothetical protein